MSKPEFQWVPEPLEGIYPDGTRWILYQTNHPKGYGHYIGRVCRHETYDGQIMCYTCEAGTFPTMHQAARALLAYGSNMIRIIKTRYFGRTEHTPSRIIATDVRTNKRIKVSYDYSADDPHALVADKLVTKLYPGQRCSYLGCNEDTAPRSTKYHVYHF